MQTFSERLRWLVVNFAGGTAAVFARKIGIKPGVLHPYLNGRIPVAEHLISIRKNIGVNLDWLLTGEGEPFGDKSDPDDQVGWLLKKADGVLRSGNSMAADALAKNIDYFHHAVEQELRLAATEKRLDKVEQLLDAATAGRIRADDPPQQKEALIKMRVISGIVKGNGDSAN